MDKNFRHQLIPQMKVYDNMGFEWLPFIMFTQPPNFRSKVVNTDDKGFRFNFGECCLIFIQSRSALNIAREDLQNKGYYKHWSKEYKQDVQVR